MAALWSVAVELGAKGLAIGPVGAGGRLSQARPSFREKNRGGGGFMIDARFERGPCRPGRDQGLGLV
jgi:hypothetical protein